MSPKHNPDDERELRSTLKEYLDLKDTNPPPAIEAHARSLVIKSAEEARLGVEIRLRNAGEDTGVHLLSTLEDIRATFQKQEVEKRIAAEKRYNNLVNWFAGIFAGIIVIVAAAGVIWAFTQIAKK